MEQQEKSYNLPLLLVVLLFIAVLLRTAWVCDDAYIIFRSVDNFVNGYGLTWNVAERVQSYTCPLWALLLSCVYFFTHEIIFTSMILSVLISLAAVVIVLKCARNSVAAIAALGIFISSRAFIDYSTSGMENPLTHFILAIFFLVYIKSEFNVRNLFFLCLIAAMGTLNRMDTLLFYLPAIAYVFLKLRNLKCVWALAAGFAPFILWECFSLVYYGFLFPNTAYAKLGTGISGSDLAGQGFFYMLNSLNVDPLTLIIIVAGIATPLLMKNRRCIPFAVGTFLYLIYVVKIGGDFMSGRFLAAPLLWATILLVNNHSWPAELKSGVAIIAIFSLGLLCPNPSLLSDSFFGLKPEHKGMETFENEIVDERMYYYRFRSFSGLLKAKRSPKESDHPGAYMGWRWKQDKEKCVTAEQLGMKGFFAGPDVHIIDLFGLSNPLSARFPSAYTPFWRVGHYRYYEPKGYRETILSGTNLIENKNIAAYYDKLSLIIRGPIFSAKRFAAIWNMNIGKYDHLISYEQCRYAYMKQVKLSEINLPKKEGTSCDAYGVHRFGKDGILIRLGKKYHADLLEISANQEGDYILTVLDGDAELERLTINFKRISKKENILSLRHVRIPEKTARKGYDKIAIFPYETKKQSGLGHIKLSVNRQ